MTGAGRLQHPAERKAVLLKLAKLIERNRHELAVMESLDSGKLYASARRLTSPIPFIRCWHAERSTSSTTTSHQKAAPTR